MKKMNLNKIPPGYYARIILLIMILFIVIAITSSCGTLKKNVNKNKHKEEVKTEVETKTEVDTKTDVAETRTITETFSTNIEFQEKRISDSLEFARLLNGEEINFEDEDLKINTRFDSITKQVKTNVIKKKKVIPVHGTKVTEETINTTQHQKASSDKKEESVSKVTDKSKVKHTEVDTSIPWYFWLMFFIVLLLVAWMVLKRIGIL